MFHETYKICLQNLHSNLHIYKLPWVDIMPKAKLYVYLMKLEISQ